MKKKKHHGLIPSLEREKRGGFWGEKGRWVSFYSLFDELHHPFFESLLQGFSRDLEKKLESLGGREGRR